MNIEWLFVNLVCYSPLFYALYICTHTHRVGRNSSLSFISLSFTHLKYKKKKEFLVVVPINIVIIIMIVSMRKRQVRSVWAQIKFYTFFNKHTHTHTHEVDDWSKCRSKKSCWKKVTWNAENVFHSTNT